VTHRRNHRRKVGGGDLRAPFPFLLRPFPVYPYCFTHPVSTIPLPTSFLEHRRLATPTLLRPTGATTAEKLEGTSSAVDYRSPSFSSSTHSPSTHIAPGDDNGSAGHGSSGSTNLSGSRGSRLKSWRGPQARWITDPLPFHPPSLPRLPLLLHPSSFNHSLSCLFSPARFVRSALSSPVLPSKNDNQSQKLDGTKYTWSRLCSYSLLYNRTVNFWVFGVAIKVVHVSEFKYSFSIAYCPQRPARPSHANKPYLWQMHRAALCLPAAKTSSF